MIQPAVDRRGGAVLEAIDVWRIYKVGAREVTALCGVQLRIEHVTMLLASHDPLVDAYVDDVLQMKDGQLM